MSKIGTSRGEAQALIIAGGAAGNHAVAGIKVGDKILKVTRYIGAGTDMTDLALITSEFTVSAADQINNAAGTNTTGDKLQVEWSKLDDNS